MAPIDVKDGWVTAKTDRFWHSRYACCHNLDGSGYRFEMFRNPRTAGKSPKVSVLLSDAIVMLEGQSWNSTKFRIRILCKVQHLNIRLRFDSAEECQEWHNALAISCGGVIGSHSSITEIPSCNGPSMVLNILNASWECLAENAGSSVLCLELEALTSRRLVLMAGAVAIWVVARVLFFSYQALAITAVVLVVLYPRVCIASKSVGPHRTHKAVVRVPCDINIALSCMLDNKHQMLAADGSGHSLKTHMWLSVKHTRDRRVFVKTPLDRNCTTAVILQSDGPSNTLMTCVALRPFTDYADLVKETVNLILNPNPPSAVADLPAVKLSRAFYKKAVGWKPSVAGADGPGSSSMSSVETTMGGDEESIVSDESSDEEEVVAQSPPVVKAPAPVQAKPTEAPAEAPTEAPVEAPATPAAEPLNVASTLEALGETCIKEHCDHMKDESFIEVSNKNGVLISKRELSEGSSPVIRGTFNLGHGYNVNDIRKFIWDADKSEYDDQFQEGKVLQSHYDDETKGLRVCGVVFKNLMGVSGRDFVHLAYWRELEPGHQVIVSKSITLPEYPEGCFVSGKVRGNMMLVAYDVKKLPDETVQLSILFQVDLCGVIPKFIINKVQSQKPMALVDIKRAFDRTKA